MEKEEYSKEWVRVDLMINPHTAEIHAIGGDREEGEGDTPYIGYEILKRWLKIWVQ